MEREREGIQEGNDISYREKLKGRQGKKEMGGEKEKRRLECSCLIQAH